MDLSMSHLIVLLLIFITVTPSFTVRLVENGKRQQPHIVFVLADDLGYNDVGYHGGSEIKTPCIDRLAMKGTRLHDYYVQPICSPSRSQLMSGRYQIHTGLQHSVIKPSQPSGLPLNNKILPEQLKACGYKTHMVGKWHLGFYKNKYLPWKRGFDTFYGILTGGSTYYSKLKGDNGVAGFTTIDSRLGPTLRDYGKYSTDVYTAKASKIISGHNTSKPLFLYLAHQAPHAPLDNPPESSNQYLHIKDKNRRKYARIVSSLDKSMCQLEQDLKQASLWDNTILIFSSDNGGVPKFGGNNWPLRGTKNTLWEGGIRSVGFINGGYIKMKNRIVHGLFHISDWMPTLLQAAKCPILQNTPQLDGVNQWGLLSRNGISKRWEILHNIDPLTVENRRDRKNTILHGFDVRVRAAIRHGPWKLITGDPGVGDWIPPPEYDMETVTSSTRGLYQLYDIGQDPLEKKNLAVRHPGVVTWLLKRLAQYNATAVPVAYPDPDPLSNPELNCGFWSPWKGRKTKVDKKVCKSSLEILTKIKTQDKL